MPEMRVGPRIEPKVQTPDVPQRVGNVAMRTRLITKPDSEIVDSAMVEKGRQLVEYLGKPFDEDGPGPSSGEEMETIILKDIIHNRQEEQDG